MITINKDKDTPFKDLPYSLAFKWVVKKPIEVQACQINEPFEVHTLEGVMKGNSGDYLMIGIKGEYYPCAKDIFEASYENKYSIDLHNHQPLESEGQEKVEEGIMELKYCEICKQIMLSRQFKERLKLSTIPQYQIANRANVNPALLSKWVIGAQSVKIGDERLVRVGALLGLKPEEIFEESTHE